MKKIFSILICVLMLLQMGTAYAAESTFAQKIEQIYSKMPEIKAYIHSEQVPTADISAHLGYDAISVNGCEPFSREEGVSFIFMYDCSTSVSGAQLARMKSTTTDFIRNKAYDNDVFTVVAFGEEIRVLADANNSETEAINAINSLKNNQNATVLFDAVNAVKEITEKQDERYPNKQMCVIFTDAVDYTVGGTTRDELLSVAETAGTPIYVVAINPSNKESIDVLGQIARKSGGEIQVATGGDIQKAFKNALKALDSVYEIHLTAKTNRVFDEPQALRIWFGEQSQGNGAERKFTASAWTKDIIAPQIVSAELVSAKELRVTFSEPVDNAAAAANYTVKKGLTAKKITSALYDEKTNAVVLSFEDALGQGGYEISVANIVDQSMEKNPLIDAFKFEISGFGAMMVNVKNFFKHFWWVIVLIIFVAVALILLSIIKKRKGIVMLDNKATFGDSIQYETVPAQPLPTHYLQLVMEMPNGTVTNLDINIVQSIIFGRAESCEVTIDDGSLSRQHFAIEVENDMLFIQNLSQTNGTYLNGVPLQSKRKLSLGDEIIAGQEKFIVKKI